MTKLPTRSWRRPGFMPGFLVGVIVTVLLLNRPNLYRGRRRQSSDCDDQAAAKRIEAPKVFQPVVADVSTAPSPSPQPTAQPTAQGWLVICGADKGNISPLFMLFRGNRYVIRTLEDNPPPIDAPRAVLLETNNKACKATPYYKEALQRRSAAALLEVSHMPYARAGTWYHEVFWPNGHRMRSLRGRPLLVRLLGEVFWAHAYGKCGDVDAVVYRSKSVRWNDCLSIHYVQGVSHAHREDGRGVGYHMEHAGDHWKGHKTHTTTKTKFCALLTGSVFKHSFYNAEALVRHATRALISEYKPCERPNAACAGNDLAAWKCKQEYKFAVTMENTQEHGYLSEKLFAGVLANTVPIYFGTPDVHAYINTKRFVFCNLTVGTVQEMRSFLPHDKGQRKPDRTWRFDAAKPRPTDDELVAWATEFLRGRGLADCVARVIALDKDEAAYDAMLAEPLVEPHQHELLDGARTARGIEEIFFVGRTEVDLSDFSSQ